MPLIPDTGLPGPIYNDVANAQSNGTAANTTFLLAANNLSDLTSVLAARTNLGLGSAATEASTAFDPAGAAAAALATAEAYARSLLGSGGSVTSFSSGNLSPLFTTSVATATTTPALSFSLSNAAANSVFGNNTSSAAAPSFQNTIDLVTSVNSTSSLLLIQNTSTGTAGAALFGIANSTNNLISLITSTGYTGAAPLTGGPTGQSAAIYTNASIALSFGTNSTAALTIGTGQTITLPAYSTAGIITNTAAGLLTSLSNASSASATLLGYLGSGSASSSTFLRGDGTWQTPGGGGTVTSITAGSGLTGGTITTSGTIAVGTLAVSSGNHLSWSNRFFVEDYANVQTAFTAACNAGGILVLPPGTTANAGSPLTWPTNFSGTVKIQGCGASICKLAGSIQLVSNASPSVEIEGFTLSSGGLVIDLNGSSYAGGQYAGCVRNVVALGTASYASDTHAFYLNSFGQGIIDKLNGQGPGNTSGNGLTTVSCSNLQGTNLTLYSYAKGLNFSGIGGAQFSNFRAVNTGYGIYANLTSNQQFQMSCWQVDNGNAPSGNLTTPCVYIQGTVSTPCPAVLTNGMVLQINTSSPAYGIQLLDTVGATLEDIDFSFCQASDSCIFISNSSSYNTVSGCKHPGSNYLVHVDATSTYNFAQTNRLGATFNNAGGATNSLLS